MGTANESALFRYLRHLHIDLDLIGYKTVGYLRDRYKDTLEVDHKIEPYEFLLSMGFSPDELGE